MSDASKLIESAMRSVVENSSWHGERDVLWGDANGQFIVQNPQYAREVYFHDFAGQQIEVGIAILDGDCNILYQENSVFAANPPRVTIGYPPRSNILHMKGGAKTLEGVSNQGYISQLEQFAARVGNPSIYNIVDFRGLPTSPISTSVSVEPGMYEKPSAPGVKQRWLGGTEELATLIAALTSGQHQLVVIIFDTEAGSLTYSTTTAVTAAGTLPSRDELTDISSITLTPGQMAVATFYLYNGQSAITQDDWLSQLDPRLTWIPFNTRVVAPNGFIQTATVTFTGSTTTETTLVGAGVGSLLEAANTCAVGDEFLLEAWGLLSTLAALPGTLNLQYKWGSVVIASTGAVTLITSLSNALWHLSIPLVVRSIGATGTVFAQGKFAVTNVAADVIEPLSNGVSTVTVDFTADNTANLTATFGTADVTNTNKIICTHLSFKKTSAV